MAAAGDTLILVYLCGMAKGSLGHRKLNLDSCCEEGIGKITN